MEQAAEIINKAANKKKEQIHGKKRQAPFVRMSSSLEYIDSMWAKYGEVYWRTTEGEVDHMSPREAILLADQINRDITRFVNKPTVTNVRWLERKRDELVERLIHVYRKAVAQRKHPETPEDKLLSYAWKGQNREGIPFTAESTFHDKVLEDKKKEFPFLHEDDILQYLRSPRFSPQQADRMLGMENAKREMRHKDPLAADKVAI